MINVDPKSLIDRLSPLARDTLEQGAGLCLGHGHYSVEIEHWLVKLLEHPESDWIQLLHQLDLDPDRLTGPLNQALEHLRNGNTRPPTLAATTLELIQNAWLLTSLDEGRTCITSGDLFVALLLTPSLRRQILDSCLVLSEIAPENLRVLARDWQPHSREAGAEQPLASPSTTHQKASATPALDKYTSDLTAQARAGDLDPVLGRDREIRQCIDVLTRRRQNNPILTGEAGVGKTAVVEGLAQRVASRDVPEPLRDVAIRVLDLGLLQAGASLKGEFENRLKQLIEEIKGSPQPIILFIDEAHTLIGAGGAEGQGDAANLLKPALARGELRTLAATTWAEYKKYFERDPALTRRFQVVQVEEPSLDNALTMMRAIAPKFQAHHGVRILDEAIAASVHMASRYITGRQLPDKSVSLLDTACARVGLSLSTTPAPIEELERHMQQAEMTRAALEQEQAAGSELTDRLAQLTQDMADHSTQLARLQAQWARERALVDEIQALHRLLGEATNSQSPTAHTHEPELDLLENSAPDLDLIHQQATRQQDREQAPPTQAPEELRARLLGLREELLQVQGQTPLIHPQVDAQAIAEVVASWTGIPVGKMMADEVANVLSLADQLERRVIGQPQALEAIAQAVRTARAGLTDPRKPQGVFLMVGPSGVGKTETALALADLLYGGPQNLTVINMAEFKEEHKVSMLLGSPPGYVGYGEGGVLTEAARRKPYSVILLDEMEKAHPGVQDVFYNLFDKGTIKDGEGRDIDFRNTLIIMTSNAGDDCIRTLCPSPEQRPAPEPLLEQLRPALLQHFKPAFLGRTTIVPYYPLDDASLLQIARISMERIARRLQSHYGAAFSVADEVLHHLVARCQEGDTGARNLENILNQSLLPGLARHCLEQMARGCTIKRARVELDNANGFRFCVDGAAETGDLNAIAVDGG